MNVWYINARIVYHFNNTNTIIENDEKALCAIMENASFSGQKGCTIST